MSDIKMPTKEDIMEKNKEKQKTSVVEDGVNEVKNFVVSTVVLPMLKNMAYDIFAGLCDMAAGAFEAKLFGSSDYSRSRRDTTRRRDHRMGYNSLYNNRRGSRRETQPEYGYEGVVFENRFQADRALEDAYDILEDTGEITIGDLNSILGLRSEYTDEDYGWRSLGGARVRTHRDGGYYIEMPRPKTLKRGN